MPIILAGISHKTAPIEIREKVAIGTGRLSEVLGSLRQHNGIQEALILSTCNRTEIYAVVSDIEASFAELKKFLQTLPDKPGLDLTPYLYLETEEKAAEQLMRVAAGLDSMIIGEMQVLGQLKSAFETARETGATGPILNTLASAAIIAGKRSRTETEISRNAVSISHAAVELTRKIFGNFSQHSILIIGAGKMSELAAKHLLSAGIKTIFVANRTHLRAEELASQFGGIAIRFESLPEYLSRADIVISSTGAPHLVLKKDDVVRAMAARRERPLFLIDIAVPRDIEAEAGKLDNVFLYDIDDLEQVVKENRREREKEIPRVERIIEEEKIKFFKWLSGRAAAPVITDLKNFAEGVKDEELKKALNKLSSLDERERQIVEALAAGITNKLLHKPIVRLKEATTRGDGNALTDAAAELFDLTGPEREPFGSEDHVKDLEPTRLPRVSPRGSESGRKKPHG